MTVNIFLEYFAKHKWMLTDSQPCDTLSDAIHIEWLHTLTYTKIWIECQHIRMVDVWHLKSIGRRSTQDCGWHLTIFQLREWIDVIDCWKIIRIIQFLRKYREISEAPNQVKINEGDWLAIDWRNEYGSLHFRMRYVSNGFYDFMYNRVSDSSCIALRTRFDFFLLLQRIDSICFYFVFFY